MTANLELCSGHRTGKGQFSFQSQRKAMSKNAQYSSTTTLISHVSKAMFKFLKVRLQQYGKHEFPDVQAGFTKGKGTRDQTATSIGSLEKQESCRKNIYLCFTDYAKAFVWITTNGGKFLKIWEYHTTGPAS